jgi:hypothetical protein
MCSVKVEGEMKFHFSCLLNANHILFFLHLSAVQDAYWQIHVIGGLNINDIGLGKFVS